MSEFGLKRDFKACFLPLKISFYRQENNIYVCLNLITGVLPKLLLVFSVCIAASTYQAIQPPPPKICGSPNGPSITAPRIKLRDGRHLAYKEHGVPRDEANHKIVVVHGSDSCRHDNAFAALLSPVLLLMISCYKLTNCCSYLTISLKM